MSSVILFMAKTVIPV